MRNSISSITWEYNIPLLTNRYMLLDFSRLLAVAFILTDVILLFATGFMIEFVIPLTVIGVAVFMVLFLLTSLLLGNHVRSVFTVDSKGVGSKMSRRMNKLNAATMVLGALWGKPGVAGSGLLASSRSDSFYPWSIIHTAIVDTSNLVISFQNNWRALQRIYCNKDNMDQVVDIVERMLPGKVVYKN